MKTSGDATHDWRIQKTNGERQKKSGCWFEDVCEFLGVQLLDICVRYKPTF
jgi:hypothetical protein